MSSGTYAKPKQDMQVQNNPLKHGQSSGSKCIESSGEQGDGDRHYRDVPVLHLVVHGHRRA